MTFAAFAAVYVGSYALNSHSGGYWLKPQPGGKYVWSSGLSFISAIYWMPRYGRYWKDSPTNVVGHFYAPLLWLDRACWHPKRDLFDDDVNEWLRTAPLDQFHPEFRQEVVDARAKWEADDAEHTAQ